MGQYVTRRLVAASFTVAIVVVLVFSMVRFLPGDYVLGQLALTGNFSPKELDDIRHNMGLDRPFFQQFGVWLGNVLQGDLGESLEYRVPVTERLARALPVSLELGLSAFILSLILGVPLGVISAWKQDSILDNLIRFMSIAWLSIPEFWAATMFVLIASLQFNWTTPPEYVALVKDPFTNLRQFLPPMVLLAVVLAAPILRLVRSSVLEVLREDYIRTARAKGLSERTVLTRHALRNALIPVVTLLGTRVGRIIGGVVILEIIFNLPGMGRFIVTAVFQRDYPMIQGVVLIIAVFTLTVNLLVDLTYSWLDPRIRYS